MLTRIPANVKIHKNSPHHKTCVVFFNLFCTLQQQDFRFILFKNTVWNSCTYSSQSYAAKKQPSVLSFSHTMICTKINSICYCDMGYIMFCSLLYEKTLNNSQWYKAKLGSGHKNKYNHTHFHWLNHCFKSPVSRFVCKANWNFNADSISFTLAVVHFSSFQ